MDCPECLRAMLPVLDAKGGTLGWVCADHGEFKLGCNKCGALEGSPHEITCSGPEPVEADHADQEADDGPEYGPDYDTDPPEDP